MYEHIILYSSHMNFRCCCLRHSHNSHVFRMHSLLFEVSALTEKSSALSMYEHTNKFKFLN